MTVSPKQLSNRQLSTAFFTASLTYPFDKIHYIIYIYVYNILEYVLPCLYDETFGIVTFFFSIILLGLNVK